MGPDSFGLFVHVGWRWSSGCSFYQEPDLDVPALTLQGHDGLAAPNVGCNGQEAPLGLAFKHVPWAHVGLGAQGGRFAGLVQPGLKPCYWESLYLA